LTEDSEVSRNNNTVLVGKKDFVLVRSTYNGGLLIDTGDLEESESRNWDVSLLDTSQSDLVSTKAQSRLDGLFVSNLSLRAFSVVTTYRDDWNYVGKVTTAART